jgi:histidine triad (HIT) family protein
MIDCLFCKIITGEIPSQKVYEDEKVLAFNDINPLAKNHWLFIHKVHTKDVNEMTSEKPEQLLDLFKAISFVTHDANVVDDGYRVVTNNGATAGQTVFHTHFHVLSGEKLHSFGAR